MKAKLEGCIQRREGLQNEVCLLFSKGLKEHNSNFYLFFLVGIIRTHQIKQVGANCSFMISCTCSKLCCSTYRVMHEQHTCIACKSWSCKFSFLCNANLSIFISYYCIILFTRYIFNLLSYQITQMQEKLDEKQQLVSDLQKKSKVSFLLSAIIWWKGLGGGEWHAIIR